MKIWTYWEGSRFAHIEVCLQSIAFHCREFEYHHVTPSTLEDHLPGGMIHPNWRKLQSPAQRADCVRAGLLFYQGGLWIDADTIMVAPPTVREEADCCHLRWSTPPDRIPNGYVYCRPHSRVAEAWLAGVNYALEQRGKFAWTGLGERVLTPIINNMPAGECVEWPLSVWQPIEVDKDVELYFTHLEWQRYAEPWTVAFGLNHSWMMHRKRAAMLIGPHEWASSPIMIHRLLSHARSVLQAAA